MRVPIGCFVLMSVSFRAAQTSQELRSKYDEPDIASALRWNLARTVWPAKNCWNRLNRSTIGETVFIVGRDY